MDTSLAPTRSNLMKLKDELSFSRLGYDLLDQKRSILVSELLTLVDQAVDYQNRVEKSLMDAEKTLQDAIMNMGRLRVANLAGAVNIDSSISLSERRVMGVSLPKVDTSFSGEGPYFSPEGTSMLSELALNRYRKALELMGKMAELKVSIMRLSSEVKKTIRKVNALEKLVIPDKEETVRYLTSRIEEQERESFILLKVVKDRMQRQEEFEKKEDRI
ncbi:MAG TPA: V-type ATP synthase subunit D [Candidatus Ornithospirochaeta stercorigallinarum]|nr:V-type ATP synthase subunit D [Candidatus Ornithospirochaeta stercorigallinarum]